MIECFEASSSHCLAYVSQSNVLRYDMERMFTAGRALPSCYSWSPLCCNGRREYVPSHAIDAGRGIHYYVATAGRVG